MNYYEGDNIGGLATIEIALQSDFISFNPAVLKAGKVWLKIPFKEETARLRPSIVDSPNGLINSYTGEFFIHHLRDDLSELNAYVGQVSILKLTDMNKKIYIIGAPGYPVSIELISDTGKQYINENGASYSFSVAQPFTYYTA